IFLQDDMDALLRLQFEETLSNQFTIFVDESIIGNRNSTEVFLLSHTDLQPVTIQQEFDIYELFVRQMPLVSRSFYNVNKKFICIPSDTAPRETIEDELLWRYWYYLNESELGYAFASYVNIPLNLNIGIPDVWLDSVIISEHEEDSRLFQFCVAQTGEVIFELKVFRMDESMTEYQDLGFQNVGVGLGGIYRYMYKAYDGCSLSSLVYITNHFYSVAN
ncbi:MAG: hypothetical protein FWG21_04075, partial [Oscillospiraceae bacterium]|nr:hypothetical protein [Oscillospiraceae bacterium]